MHQVNELNHSTIKSIEIMLTSIGFSARRNETTYANLESIDAFNASSREFTTMESLLVKVVTRDGLVGWGEAFGHKSNPATLAALEEIVCPFFIGRDSNPNTQTPAAERAFHAFGRTGPVHYALSAVDTALWDITAQRADLPLRKLLCPEARDHVTGYASLVHYGEDPIQVANQLHVAQRCGFRAYKLHESTVEAISAARTAVGRDQLMVDVNCKWSVREADAVLTDLEPLGLLWMEEPVFPPDDSAGLRLLNSRHHNKIAAGENHSGVRALIADMERGAMHYAQPSVGKIGGVSAMLEVLSAGRRVDAAVVPHNFYYGPALLATAQLIATTAPNGLPELEIPFLQWDSLLHPWHAPHQNGVMDGGSIPLPDSPGLGFNPDPDVLQRNRIIHRVIG